MPTYGKLEAFDPESGNWNEYSEQMDQFFAANDITTDTKKRSIFLSSCGQKCYTLLRSLLSPTLPSSLTFDQLTKALKTHQHPPPSVTMERFNFYKRDRKPGESIAQYVACLRKLCEYCQFGESLNDMIRDRLVCGVNEDIIQQRLLSEATLTLETIPKNHMIYYKWDLTAGD